MVCIDRCVACVRRPTCLLTCVNIGTESGVVPQRIRLHAPAAAATRRTVTPSVRPRPVKNHNHNHNSLTRKDKRLHVNTRNIQRQLYPCTATEEVD